MWPFVMYKVGTTAYSELGQEHSEELQHYDSWLTVYNSRGNKKKKRDGVRGKFTAGGQNCEPKPNCL